MYCRICGDENNARYYSAQRQALCPTCRATTPAKVSRESFDKRYWGSTIEELLSKGQPIDPPGGIRREFYADYLASSKSLSQYIETTTSAT